MSLSCVFLAYRFGLLSEQVGKGDHGRAFDRGIRGLIGQHGDLCGFKVGDPAGCYLRDAAVVDEECSNPVASRSLEFGIEFGLIVCAMRHHSEEMNWRMIRTAREYLGSGVCAADLAGAEAIYPMSEFKNLFQNTHKIGMPFTIHAGECGSAQNIIDSVEAGARRIGHGIAMRGHSDLIKELAEKGIGIEMCPISNLQTKAVAGPEEYPIREFLNGGLKVTVNTDNRTVSDTTMTKELEFIQNTYGIQDDEIYLLMKNAADVAFAEDYVKDKLYRIMRKVYGA